MTTTNNTSLVERVARIIDPYIPNDGSHVSHMAWQIALGKADAALAALSDHGVEME